MGIINTNLLPLLGTGGNPPDGTYVDEVYNEFQNYGSGSDRTVDVTPFSFANGGLVVSTRNESNGSIYAFDTVRGESSGSSYFLKLNGSNSNSNTSNFGIHSLANNQYQHHDGWSGTNANNERHHREMWAEHEGFFDIVQYEGNGSSNRAIAHSLNATVGQIMIKNIDDGGNTNGSWMLWHRGVASQEGRLNSNEAFTTSGVFGNGSSNTQPTTSNFYVSSDNRVNKSGDTYIAYLWAHDAQIFGNQGKHSIIKCGSYSGNGNSGETTGKFIDLGWQPQMVMIRRTNNSGYFYKHDRSRSIGGIAWNHTDNPINGWGNTGTENGYFGLDVNKVSIEGNGFRLTADNEDINIDQHNGNGDTYIYMAVRKQDCLVSKPQTDKTKIFTMAEYTSNQPSPNYQRTVVTSHVVDWIMYRGDKNTSSETYQAWPRPLQGVRRRTRDHSYNESETPLLSIYQYGTGSGLGNGDYFYQCLKDGQYSDMVTYRGNGSTTAQTIPHSLGEEPSCIWITNNGGSGQSSILFWKEAGFNRWMKMNSDTYSTTFGLSGNGNVSYVSNVTSTSFDVAGTDCTNKSGAGHMAVLFKNTDFFKAGEYTAGSGQTTVDTGFGAPRCLIIKRRNQVGNWGWFQPDGWTYSNQEVRLNETTARDSSNFVHTGGYGFVPYGAYTTNTGIYCYMAFK